MLGIRHIDTKQRGLSIAAFSALLLSACSASTSVRTVGRGRAASADAEIVLESADGGNHRLSVDVSHLPPPERLADRFDRYAVWVRPHGEDLRLAGRLVYDEEARTGFFSTVTPFEDIEVILSAESSRDMSDLPIGRTVFRERISLSSRAQAQLPASRGTIALGEEIGLGQPSHPK